MGAHAVPVRRCFSLTFSMIRTSAAAMACAGPSSVSSRVGEPFVLSFCMRIFVPDCDSSCWIIEPPFPMISPHDSFGMWTTLVTC